MSPPHHLVTRLAPSPTGALHLGNARTFLLNYLMARQGLWRILCRIDDLDGPRIRRGADQQALDDLAWLGIEYDGAPIYQSTRGEIYQEAVRRLLESGAAYPCICSRSEVASAASAPHASDGATVYPGTCRGRFASIEEARRAAASGNPPCIRFMMPAGRSVYEDGFRGRVEHCGAELGDFVIMKGDGTPAYQLASIVDDTLLDVTHVVRGDDLLDSVPRQLALRQALYPELGVNGLTFYHLPLVVGKDGRRLAKRHGDTRIASYRSIGYSPGDVLRQLAVWSGIDPPRVLRSARDLEGRFSLTDLPRHPVVSESAELHRAQVPGTTG